MIEATTETPPNRAMIVAAGSMGPHSSDIRYFGNTLVANWETDAVAASRYRSTMSGSMARWVRGALAHAEMSQVDLAHRLTDRLKRSFDKAATNKMASGKRGVAADEMYAISEITGFPPPDEGAALTRVPLLDWVTAGKLAMPASQIPVEEVPFLTFTDLGSGDFFALKVSGDSMDRVSPDGSTIIVNRADKQMVAGRCYVFSLRGQTTYKRWQPAKARQPSYLEPHTTNSDNKPIFFDKRHLVVIGRVRRTLLDL